MNIPENLKYTKSHEWIKINGKEGVIGITDYAQGELGDIVYVEIETKGEKIKRDETFGTIEAVKTVSDLYMPLSGDVIEVNPIIDKKPETINTDPYGDGWLIKIKIDVEEEIDDLMDSKGYEDMINA